MGRRNRQHRNDAAQDLGTSVVEQEDPASSVVEEEDPASTSVTAAVEECLDREPDEGFVEDDAEGTCCDSAPFVAPDQASALAAASSPDALPAVAGDAPPDQACGAPADPLQIRTVDVPLLSTPAYAPQTLKRLSRRHAQTLRQIADGLAYENARLDGHPVRNPDEALAWLLEQLTVEPLSHSAVEPLAAL